MANKIKKLKLRPSAKDKSCEVAGCRLQVAGRFEQLCYLKLVGDVCDGE